MMGLGLFTPSRPSPSCVVVLHKRYQLPGLDKPSGKIPEGLKSAHRALPTLCNSADVLASGCVASQRAAAHQQRLADWLLPPRGILS